MSDRKFKSLTDQPVRVTMPDGRIVVVGINPTPLHPDFHREAMKAGCAPADDPSATPAAPIEPTLEERIEQAIIFAAASAGTEHDVVADAFSSSGLPQVRWIEKHIGLSITAADRDRAWDAVKPQLGLDK